MFPCLRRGSALRPDPDAQARVGDPGEIEDVRPRLRAMSIDRAALAAGSIRLASGISFLVDPVRANRLWGDPDEPAPTARLLLRSMGYRDALIGGLLAAAALRGRNTRGWFLASGGADAADLLGGISVHHEMKRSQRIIGLGGAVIGIGVGLWGATRRTQGAGETQPG
jgi:hypothetical protein